jgi:hypothetical protein
MKERIAVLPIKERDALGAVRNLLHLRVAEDGDLLWLRGIEADAGPNLRVQQLPVLNTYTLDEHGNLFPVGGTTPTNKLKELKWYPVAEYVNVELPTSALPGMTAERYKVRITASAREREAKALMTSFSVWEEYATRASELRLERLRFAVSENKDVLILGTPLPPIPGKEFWMHHSILIPCGFDFEVTLVADLLAEKLDPSHNSIFVFNADGAYEKISNMDFAPATRSAVRLTKKNLYHE